MGNIDVFSHAILYICFPVNVQSDLSMYSRTHYFIYTFQWMCNQIYRCILARNTLYILSSECAIRSSVRNSRTPYFIYTFQWMCNQIYRCILARTTLYILSCKWAIRFIDVFSHALLYIYFPVNGQ